MKFQKGHEKKGGRVKGSVNKTSRQIAEICEANGELKPAEYLLKVMHSKETEQSVKIECAKHLLPYTDKKMPISQEIDQNIMFPEAIDIQFTEPKEPKPKEK